MGQQEVLKAIEKLKFTTLKELNEELNLSIPSITKSLTTLVRWEEIIAIQLEERTLYLSKEFVEELSFYE